MDRASAFSNGGYPPGAANDPRAPYNQKEPAEVEVEVTVSVTYSKNFKVVVQEGYTDADLREVIEEMNVLPAAVLAVRASQLSDPDEQLEMLRRGDTTKSISDEIKRCKGWHTDEFEVVPAL